METGQEANTTPTPSGKKYYIDSTYLYKPREGVELMSPMKDGLSKGGGSKVMGSSSH
jgi:hypothetical protein